MILYEALENVLKYLNTLPRFTLRTQQENYQAVRKIVRGALDTPRATPEQIAQARKLYENDELRIDDEAFLSVS